MILMEESRKRYREAKDALESATKELNEAKLRFIDEFENDAFQKWRDEHDLPQLFICENLNKEGSWAGPRFRMHFELKDGSDAEVTESGNSYTVKLSHDNSEHIVRKYATEYKNRNKYARAAINEILSQMNRAFANVGSLIAKKHKIKEEL